MRDVTLVTGASQGIGAELARALAADGRAGIVDCSDLDWIDVDLYPSL